MQNPAIIQDDHEIREKAIEIEQTKFDQSIKSLLRQLFKNKPYFRRYMPIMIILFIYTLFESLVSAFGAYSYTLGLLKGFVNESLIVVLGIIILSCIEFLKHSIGLSFFKNFKANLANYYLLGSLVIITAISIYLTVKGTNQAVHTYTAPPTLVDTDSIKKEYNTEIASLQKDIDFFQDKANTEASNWTIINVTLPDLKDQKEERTLSKDKALEDAKIENEAILIDSKSKTVTTAFKVSNNAWILNVFALLAQFALGTMLRKSAINYEVLDKESEGGDQSGADSQDVTAKAVGSSVSSIDLPTPQVRQIGFKIPEKAPENPNLKMPETHDFQGFQPEKEIDFQSEFSPEKMEEIQVKYKVLPLDKICLRCRNKYRRWKECKGAADKLRNKNEFEETYAYLTELGAKITKTSEKGLSIEWPES